jgi:hypothetical protein
MAAALKVDGVLLSDETDFAKLAADALQGYAAIAMFPSDSAPLDGVFRFYDKLKGTPWADRFSEGIAAALTHSSIDVRREAVFFFRSRPAAAGGARIADLVVGPERQLFPSDDPQGEKSSGLEWELLRALGARIQLGDARALQVARDESLKPGKAHGVIAGLASHDTKWVVDNAEKIVSGSPEIVWALLKNLQRVGADVEAVGKRIARLPGVNPSRFRDAVERALGDPGAVDRICAALPSLQ